MTTQEQTNERETQRTTSLVSAALALGSILVLVAAGVFVWSGVTTASGRIAATTSNESSLLTAASIDLVVEGSDEATSTGLLLDASGLYPGLVVERCLGVTYWGSPSDVPLRMSGRAGGGDGLEAFIDATIETGTGSDPDCADFDTSETLFEATLLEFWERHGSFETGLPLM